MKISKTELLHIYKCESELIGFHLSVIDSIQNDYFEILFSQNANKQLVSKKKKPDRHPNYGFILPLRIMIKTNLYLPKKLSHIFQLFWTNFYDKILKDFSLHIFILKFDQVISIVVPLNNMLKTFVPLFLDNYSTLMSLFVKKFCIIY